MTTTARTDARTARPGRAGRGPQFRTLYDSALAGAMGALVGLFLYVEFTAGSSRLAQADALWWARDLLAGVTLGGSIGFSLNAVGPLRDGAWLRLARAASWGAVVGAAGGAAGLVLGELALGGLQGGLIGRAVAWAILGLGIGVSQGLAYPSRQRLAFGVLGGALGGFLGGLLFEWFREGQGQEYDPAFSQGLGILVLGAGLGFCIAGVEQVLRRAWVVVLSGRQEGRAYLLPARLNRLGLDEHAEVGLFGDPEMARRHAEITTTGGRFTLSNLDLKGRTTINGSPAPGTTPLQDGDRIVLGRTTLLFRHR